MQHIELLHGDCLEVLKQGPDNSVDLVVTSPPYDNLRTYNNSLGWDFEGIGRELFRVLKPGGVLVWVVGDACEAFNETGSSFKQALFFKSTGLNLLDTMIYLKQNYAPAYPSLCRYANQFEYMFVFSKGKPKAFNPKKVEKAESTKQSYKGRLGKKSSFRQKDGSLSVKTVTASNGDYKDASNVWSYPVGGNKTGHPAVFPLQLALDHILSWSNPGDLVMDPFLGSGTTGIAAAQTGRSFIGIEKEPNYFSIAENRIKAAQAAQASSNTNNTKVVNE